MAQGREAQVGVIDKQRQSRSKPRVSEQLLIDSHEPVALRITRRRHGYVWRAVVVEGNPAAKLSPGAAALVACVWLETRVSPLDDKVGTEVLPRLRVDNGRHAQDVTVASLDRVARFQVGLARDKRAEILPFGVDQPVPETEWHRVSTPSTRCGSRSVSHKALGASTLADV